MVAASIIVRSYRRPRSLLDLVERLRHQRHSSFEIVIVEQSADPVLLDVRSRTEAEAAVKAAEADLAK